MTSERDEGTTAISEAKTILRRQVLARRAARPAAQRRAEDEARLRALAEALAPAGAIALYHPKAPEPDVMGLVHALPGRRFLLPVLGRFADGTPRRQPDWAWWEGPDAIREGIWGIQEPTTPALGSEALAEVDAVVCSGLAADLNGWRCGVGGGWYDRALAFRRPGTPAIIALNEAEVVASVPHEEFDRRVDAIATGRGVRWVSTDA